MEGARCFARIDQLAWDLDARTITLQLTSLRDQEISLFAWHGVERLSAEGAAAARDGDSWRLSLTRGTPASVSLRLAASTPRGWRGEADLHR